MQPTNQTQETERLRAATADENLSSEQRDIAAKLLAELEKPKSTTTAGILEQCFADIHARYAAYCADQLARFKVCSVCCLKQSKANETCELCGAPSKWESPLPDSNERSRQIAATTKYTDDELNHHIAHSSMRLGFVKHCADVLELRGVERVRSFWERAGFNMFGRPRD